MNTYYKIMCYTCNKHLLMEPGINTCSMCRDKYTIRENGLWQHGHASVMRQLLTGSQLEMKKMIGVKL